MMMMMMKKKKKQHYSHVEIICCFCARVWKMYEAGIKIRIERVSERARAIE
jgi:hypothetical protein